MLYIKYQLSKYYYFQMQILSLSQLQEPIRSSIDKCSVPASLGCNT
jgi:hypothetical protein